MLRVPAFLKVSCLLLVLVLLTIRVVDTVAPASVADSSADMTVATRIGRLLGWSPTDSSGNRILRLTVHIFEARSTGVLPLALPPLEPAAVIRYGDRVFDIVRDTAQYYSRLVSLYPAAQFELLSAEEAVLNVDRSSTAETTQELVFEARGYTVRVDPSSLDESNWLSAQITVNRGSQFLLANRVTSLADGTPIVVGGPVGDGANVREGKAVFVGVTARYVSESGTTPPPGLVFSDPMFDKPPRLLKMAGLQHPSLGDSAVGIPSNETAGETGELEGMPIFLTHLDAQGRVVDVVLVSSLRADYDAAAAAVVTASEFLPASRKNTPVESWMFVPVRFQSARRRPEVSASPSD